MVIPLAEDGENRYTGFMKRSELVTFLSSYLELDRFEGIDPSTNGLVVGAPEDRDIQRVVCAVDASLATFQLAIRQDADLLLVHHGLFWGRPLPVTGNQYQRLRLLMDHQLDLFVSHLPLDAHAEVGNNAQMANILGLSDLKPFAPYHGINLGWWGRSETALSPGQICRKLGFSDAVVLPFGEKEIHTVGFVSGAGSDDVDAALDLGLDCFVTGVAEHEQFSTCEERHITMIGGGHYQSEVFGVQALGRLLSDQFGLKTVFVDHPTGL